MTADFTYGVGRRQRAYARAASRYGYQSPVTTTWQDGKAIETVRDHLAVRPLRDPSYIQGIVTERGGYMPTNSQLPKELHDLALEIVDDMVEACAALDDPDIWYPGVDEGIEPVPDSHVELVIWGLQRELDRETRGLPKRPAAPLAELPWRVQRALAERRRLRYNQFGIFREQWEKNEWSIWDVPEDPEWIPRRVARTGKEWTA